MRHSPLLNAVRSPERSDLAPSEDKIFRRLRGEAQEAAQREPDLAGFLHGAVLSQRRLEDVIARRIAQRLQGADAAFAVIFEAFTECFDSEPDFGAALRADLSAVLDRDPACRRYLEPALYFKGFHAIQTYRLAHACWRRGRSDFALLLQSLSAQTFQTDIHPAASIGKAFFLDHATGVVIGSTAVVEDDVSMLHGVTLGGSGRAGGERHPKVRRGVLIGAGAQILGNIEIGARALVAAGSVVLDDVPPHKTVAGVPARVVGETGAAEPAAAMDQVHDMIDAGL